jgi:hypothetical protein
MPGKKQRYVSHVPAVGGDILKLKVGLNSISELSRVGFDFPEALMKIATHRVKSK